MERSLRSKLASWQEPGVRFVVVRDQDALDCRVVKRELAELCAKGGRPDAMVRIVCRELEAWYLGDFDALAQVYGPKGLVEQRHKAPFRDPDGLPSPSRLLATLIPAFTKADGARKLGPIIDLDACRSQSFPHHPGRA